jgi:hypothetical protein
MITINIPHYEGEYDKAEDGKETQLMRDAKVIKDKVLKTLKVVEWGLFDG